MIRPNVQHNLANARSYFREHLCVGDYYSEQDRVRGEWFGAGATALGLEGKVRVLPFLALCEGNHPRTGQRLTLRRNTVRREFGALCTNRRVFFDFVFSPAKSVSIVALMQDARVVELHASAVRVALQEMERYAETRVRKAGGNATRRTGNVVAALFQHETSRELDPHLHTHCVMMNATFDPVEQRWKALDVSEMYRAQRFADACYQHEIAKGLRQLGYALDESPTNFEIRGVSADLIALFSKRHQQIDAEAERVANATPDGIVDEFLLRERIARNKRRRKQKDATADQLRPKWRQQLSAKQQAKLATLAAHSTGAAPQGNAEHLIRWGEEAVFERNAVAREHQVLASALLRGRGTDLSISDIKEALGRRRYVRPDGSDDISLVDQALVELRLVDAARRGIGTKQPLGAGFVPAATLSGEQAQAAKNILESRDWITVFRGGAGTGKSYVLKQVADHLKSRESVVILAPQNQQVQALKRDGLEAQTLSSLLVSEKLPFAAVVIVDEAGQIGARQLARLAKLVETRAGRLILCGDTRQHGAVEATDGLALLETKAGLSPTTLTSVRRQDPNRARTRSERDLIRNYRHAVKAAADSKVDESFTTLDRQGWIDEVRPNTVHQAVADAFAKGIAEGESVLAVSQTRASAAQLNRTIRQRLVVDGKLGESRLISTVQDTGSTVADRQNPASYGADSEIIFLRSYGRFRRGDVVRVTSATEKGIKLEKDGRSSTLGYAKADRFSIVRRVETEVAVGERLRLRFNGRSAEGHRIANGETVTVVSHRADGGLSVSDDQGRLKTLSPTQRQFSWGYASTSYGSQGQTVDTVLFADAGEKAATNRKQWYVSISRGRRRVRIFTDDKDRLRETIRSDGQRRSAIDQIPELPDSLDSVLALAAGHFRFRAIQARRLVQAIRPRVGVRFRHTG